MLRLELWSSKEWVQARIVLMGDLFPCAETPSAHHFACARTRSAFAGLVPALRHGCMALSRATSTGDIAGSLEAQPTSLLMVSDKLHCIVVVFLLLIIGDMAESMMENS